MSGYPVRPARQASSAACVRVNGNSRIFSCSGSRSVRGLYQDSCRKKSRKAMDRRKWSFPIVGVAAARFGDGIQIAVAGVAPIPWMLDSTSALEEVTPLPGTAYKVEIARALVRRAIDAVKSGSRS